MTLTFTPAARVAEHARLLLDGLPGAGALAAALRIARGLLGEDGVIGVVDTERGAAARLADDHEFLHLRVDSCSPKVMPDITAAAVAAGVDCLIIATFTSFWSGRDGLLMLVDSHRKSPSQSGWYEARPHEQAMMDALLSYPGHVIATLRVKSDVVIGGDEAGRPAPWKVALKPDHRDGLEYDFHVAASVGLDGALTVTSSCIADDADLAVGAIHAAPGEEFGAALADWLGQGETLPTLRDYLARAAAPDATSAELRALAEETVERGMDGLTVRDRRGRSGPLFALLMAQAKWLAQQEQRSQQTPPQAPAAPPAPSPAAPPAGPDTSSLTPPAPGVPPYLPDDKTTVAELTLRIAHAADADLLAGVAQDLADLKEMGVVSQDDHTHLFRALEQRRVNLGLPHGQTNTASEGAAS